MATLLIANNCTRESGSFMGDQLCAMKTAYLMVQNAPADTDRIIMSVSPDNEMGFLWQRLIDTYKVELISDDWNPGDWSSRWVAWDKWFATRQIEGISFNYYREMYLRIHGAQRQHAICGSERGLGRANIYEYWAAGQEDAPDMPLNDVPEWDNHGVYTRYSFDDDLIYHPALTYERDVYISPHAKTQGNVTFTFDFWADVVHRLVEADVSVTVGYNGYFCEDLNGHPLYRKHWGSHQEWMEQVCKHKLVSCGNTGTGWLAAACGVPMITMEPPNSQMPDHRYRECGLRNLVEVVDRPDSEYVARRIVEQVKRAVVLTTGCYDVLHAGHVRHLERARALGTRLIVALNSDISIKALKGHSRPINPQHQRKAVLEALRCVDEVRLFDGPDALPLIREIKPDVLACGFGYTLDTIIGRELVAEWGGKVVVTCYGDASNEPSTTKIVKRARAADVVEICRIGANASVNPFEKLKLMADHLLSVKELPGDVADLGACRGGTSLIMRRLAPEKHLHIFDTWEGTPYNDPLCHHKKGEWPASLQDCMKLVGNNILTHYWDGVFPATTFGLVEDVGFCFVYVDMDTEQATRDAIKFFWPRMVKGGQMFFDDYLWGACDGVQKAVDEIFPPKECEKYSTVEGVAKRHVVPSLYTCIIEKP